MGRGRVYLLLAVVTVISGLTPVAARMATSELPPLTLAWVRFGTAGILLAATLKGLRLPNPRFTGNWPLILGLGALCVPINQVGFLFGIRLANASHAGISYALVPVIVFWISLALRRTTFTARMVLATTLASAGAVGVVLATSGVRSGNFVFAPSMLGGDLLLLFAAFTWSLFAVLSQPVVRSQGAIATLTAVFLVGSAMHTPLVLLDGLFFDLRSFSFSQVTSQGLAGLAFITLITAYTNYLLWYLVVARFEVTRSAIVTNASFIVTVVVEALLFEQQLSWKVAVGSAVLLTGIVLAGPSAASERIPGPRPVRTEG
jgi:drug/metabolite transporter (DMT)-like permease